ncbi:YaiI/YqxD family protein [Jeotgalibacillus proteolyticus]|uniref:YaiI/YqxD family protein n=1 Tax=Jeotgalibacillus proteolyticus TaxID=2082395 RepID=UPI003CE6CC25
MVFIDADACPKELKKIIEEQALAYGTSYLFVASFQHFSADADQKVWTFIDEGKEAVDLYILNHVKRGDLVITQDIGLASLVLPKGVYALSTRGKQYQEDTIDTSLAFRYLHQMERKKGRYGGGPKKLSSEDVKNFSDRLIKYLARHAGKN